MHVGVLIHSASGGRYQYGGSPTWAPGLALSTRPSKFRRVSWITVSEPVTMCPPVVCEDSHLILASLSTPSSNGGATYTIRRSTPSSTQGSTRWGTDGREAVTRNCSGSRPD